jgi:acyl-CoA thioester hydrolase
MENAATGEVVAVTVLTGVHIDTEQRRSCELPEEHLARARAMVSDFDPGI